jgi:gliding motility-associated-like protein
LEEKTITKTPDGWILNVGEDPQNVPFNVTGKVTGISDKTDYVRTYWRMTFEPDASGGTLNPPLPHTAASPKEIALGTTSDESQVSFTIANTDAGTYDLWYVVRDVFYNKADSIKTRIVVKRPVSIQPLAAFTPNGDGQNDVWTIRNIESFPDVGVRIVNERGELVFETSSVARLPERGWDGRRRDGKLAPEGAYYYQFFDNRDQTLVATGSFVILR